MFEQITTQLSQLGIGPWQGVAIVGAFLAGGLLKGMFGFGLPLAGVTLLSNVLPVELALALNAVPPFLTNFWQARLGDGMAATARRFWPLLVMLPPFTLAGAWVAASLDGRVLFALLAAVVLAFIALNKLRPDLHLPARWERPASYLVGVLTGLLGGISTINGPPLVIYLIALKLPREQFVAALGLIFLVSALCINIAFGSVGILTLPLAMLSALCALPVLVGMAVGRRLAAKFDQRRFQNGVLIVLAVLALNMLRRAFA